MTFPCPKCGSGLYDIHIEPSVTLLPKIDLFPRDNYCSKCGASLRTTCWACNGTGKKLSITVLPNLGPKYCSECGRRLPEKKRDTTCSACGGTGKISTHHICMKPY